MISYRRGFKKLRRPSSIAFAPARCCSSVRDRCRYPPSSRLAQSQNRTRIRLAGIFEDTSRIEEENAFNGVNGEGARVVGNNTGADSEFKFPKSADIYNGTPVVQRHISTMSEVISAICGFVAGVLVDWLLRDRFYQSLSKLDRKLSRSRLEDVLPSNGSTVCLGDRDTLTTIIDGDGVNSIKPENIKIELSSEELPIPESLAAVVSAIQEEQESKKNSREPFAWNGDAVHVQKFVACRTVEDDEPLLLLSACRAKYFHLMATSFRIHDEFVKDRSQTTKKLLIDNFNEWRLKTPPNLANGLPINIFVITDDEQIVFARRSTTLAVAAGEITFTVNENFHPVHDFPGSGKFLDVRQCVRRAFEQELGWYDSEHENSRTDMKMDLNLLAFAIHTGTCCYSIFGYVKLPLSAKQVSEMFLLRAKDKMEIAEFIPVRLREDAICEFIHKNNLYDMTGVGAMLTLFHVAKLPNAARAVQKFRELQTAAQPLSKQ